MLGRLRDKYSIYGNHEKGYPKTRWHNGLQIDFFIYDTLIPEPFATLYNNYNGKLKRKYTLNKWGEWLAFAKKDIFPLKHLKFEDQLFPAPNKYKKHLKLFYGDYLTRPPVEQRVCGYIEPFTPCKHKEILQWRKKNIP
ncbi:MAG: LicD family protein [Deltaproteobacteria bacterium]|nr:LicD family protein [Deltaproteobacteria bacterium]